MEKPTGNERLRAAKERKKLLSRERSKRYYEKKKREKDGDAKTEGEMARAILKDMKEAISSVKQKRSDDARTAINVGISMLCGETVASKGLQTHVASALGINRRRIAMSLQHRRSVLNPAFEIVTPWTLIKRKTRNDATPEEVRKVAYEFWQKAGISRPTGNKRDVARKRVGPKEYIEHEKHILEKTQTEVYRDFKQQYPNIEMGQRYFETCKPFFVIPARAKDRNSCCCRKHVEIQMVFKRCMDYRRKHEPVEGVKVYSHLSELLDDTLCPLQNHEEQLHEKACIDRNCKDCGIEKLTLLPEETDATNEMIEWQRFEYVVSANDRRKLQIVSKTTSVSELFQYFLELLKDFPSHQFRAKWQNDQMKALIQHLPDNHVCCVHDYSENYTCQHQDQIQSLYYGQTQVSIHVTIIHRHPVDIDDEEDPLAVVTEHFYVISPDLGHDSHSVHHNRELVVKYLNNIGCKIEVLHEWTDGCSTQYKSRHCMGDVSQSKLDFGITTIRNFFETSHAKGPQDGAGANLKYKCDMAVIQRQVMIQNAKDLYDFVDKEFRNPAPSRYQSNNVRLKRRVFSYVEEVNRNRPYRLFNEVKGNRQIHSILGESQTGTLLKTRKLSCYCSSCIDGNYDNCEQKDVVDEWDEEIMTTERTPGDQRITRSSFQQQNCEIADLACKDSVVAVASADRGEEYYLLQVTGSGPETLNKEHRDDWGCRYPAGTKVLRGLFFDKLPLLVGSQQSYQLITNREAMVYAATVRFICQELTIRDNQCIIPLKTHEEILGSLDGF